VSSRPTWAAFQHVRIASFPKPIAPEHLANRFLLLASSYRLKNTFFAFIGLQSNFQYASVIYIARYYIVTFKISQVSLKVGDNLPRIFPELIVKREYFFVELWNECSKRIATLNIGVLDQQTVQFIRVWSDELVHNLAVLDEPNARKLQGLDVGIQSVYIGDKIDERYFVLHLFLLGKQKVVKLLEADFTGTVVYCEDFFRLLKQIPILLTGVYLNFSFGGVMLGSMHFLSCPSWLLYRLWLFCWLIAFELGFLRDVLFWDHLWNWGLG
jgi:hypothetical protein